MSTSSKKLAAVNAALGNFNITKQQDTTRVIYDRVSAGNGIGVFFQNFAGKTQWDTNLNKNFLDTEESLVINEVIIYGAGEETVILNSPCLLNVTIGNQKVIKDFGIQFDGAPGLQHYPVNQSNGSADRNIVSIPLITSIVIPPQVVFGATLQFARQQDFELVPIKLGFKGYAKIFNPGMSL